VSIVEKAIKKMSAGGAPQVERRVASEMPAMPVQVSGPQRPTRKQPVTESMRNSPEYTVPGRAAHVLRDEVRRIKRALLERIPAGNPVQPRELLITSSLPSEGKTFMTLNIAQSVAQERDCGVLLIDGDLARPRMSAILGMSDAPGLTNLLLDPALNPFDYVVETDIPGLWFLPAGPHTAQSPELLASARMRSLLAQFHAADPTRVVLFDSPPLLASNEAQALGQLVNNIVLIVRGQDTNPSVVSEALGTIPEASRWRWCSTGFSSRMVAACMATTTTAAPDGHTRIQ
jgi:Mrp family chromosome partitioning ATPase